MSSGPTFFSGTLNRVRREGPEPRPPTQRGRLTNVQRGIAAFRPDRIDHFIGRYDLHQHLQARSGLGPASPPIPMTPATPFTMTSSTTGATDTGECDFECVVHSPDRPVRYKASACGSLVCKRGDRSLRYYARENCQKVQDRVCASSSVRDECQPKSNHIAALNGSPIP